METSESRFSNRGALIAVIKIQIDPQRTNSIYLHQNDDDYRLAQDFVQKSKLSSNIINFIYEKIKVTRASLEDNHSRVQTIQPTLTPFSYEQQNQKTSRNKITPQQINTHREDVYEEEQSFGKLNRKISEIMEQTKHYPNLYGDTKDELFSCPKKNVFDRLTQMQASPKKKKQFLFYDSEFNQQDSGIDVNLFANEQTNKRNGQLGIQKIEGRKITQHQQTDRSLQSEYKSKGQQILDTREATLPLRVSQSASKLRYNDTRNQCNLLMNTQTNRGSSVHATKMSDYDKPTHVKIIRKEEMNSLNQSLKRSMSKQQISKINKDVTRRLYNEADIKKNYLNIIKQKAKKQKEIIQDKELTHKPQLNRISKMIAEGRKKNDVPVQMYLIEQGKKIEAKKHQQFNLQTLKQIQNCSFHPHINIISQKLVADKSRLSSKISEAKCRKSNIRDQNMFRPSLNRVTNELMKDRGTFQERQREYLEQKNTKLVELVKQRQMHEKIDQASGQQLFKPKIHDIGIRQNQGTNIGNYLYELSKQNEDKIQDSRDYRPKINESSENLVQQMYSKRIGWLFSELDSDQDGVISAQKINIENISVDLLGIIKPILFEMQEMGEELSLIDFKNAVDILHKKLNTFEKSILYNYKQKIIK